MQRTKDVKVGQLHVPFFWLQATLQSFRCCFIQVFSRRRVLPKEHIYIYISLSLSPFLSFCPRLSVLSSLAHSSSTISLFFFVLYGSALHLRWLNTSHTRLSSTLCVKQDVEMSSDTGSDT